jgi:hypothetical protein
LVSTTVSTTAFASAIIAVPLIADGLDAPANEITLAGATAASLALTTRPGFMVKRIVGSIFCQSTDTGGQQRLATFGIITDRVTPNGTLANIAAWDPFKEDSVQKRWLFRRTWLLEGNTVGTTVPFSSNRSYGSLREGTYIDSKVKARVSYEERLFLIYSVQAAPGSSGTATSTQFLPQLRMYANPFTGNNR